MEQEKDFEQYLGGAPKAAVKEFPKVGELSEDDLDFPMAGYTSTTVASDYQFNDLQKESVFREQSVADEKTRMFAELDQTAQQETSNTHTM